MSLRDKLLKNSTSELTDFLIDSKFYNKKDMVPTPVPLINVALSGMLDGGITPGVTQIAGESKHFKTGFALFLAACYLKKYPDGAILFYDSEFGTPQPYFKRFGIDLESVIHTPVSSIEELRHDLVTQLDGLDRDDKAFIIIDSIGNLASNKEVADALKGDDKADMTRAKVLKSLFRIIGTRLTIKDTPLVAINHIYKEIGPMYPKNIVGGGCLEPGTKIMMSDGSLKEIQDITVGEMVETYMGPKSVTHTWNPDTLEDGEPECYEVEFDDGTKVVCSEEHSFLVGDRWVKAPDLLNNTVSIINKARDELSKNIQSIDRGRQE